jgi:branched-chain amino acid transport system substrate-binding protein
VYPSQQKGEKAGIGRAGRSQKPIPQMARARSTVRDRNADEQKMETKIMLGRSFWKSLALLIATLTMAPTLFAQQAIKIGAINPYSGPLALYGLETFRGYELATEKINAAGGVLGRKIELIKGDAANAQQGIGTVEQLTSIDKVDLFIGTYISAISQTASETAARVGKLYWETNASAPALTDRGLTNFLRTGPTGITYARDAVSTVRDLIAPNLKKDIKGLKVWVEHEDSIYGVSVNNALKAQLEALGAVIVYDGTHSARALDLNDTVLRAKKANPDVLINTGYVPDSNLLLKTLREQDFKPGAILLIGTGDTPETVEALGAQYMEGIMVICYTHNDITEAFGPGAAEYLSAYRAKYKSDPIAPQAMGAYSGALMLFDTIKVAGSIDMDKIRSTAVQMDKPFSTYPSGWGIKFDKNFQNERAAMTAAQWQSGKVVTVFPTSAALPGVKLKGLGRP